MSRINGDKARSAVERRRRTAQRMKDRVKHADLRLNPPVAKPRKVAKPKPKPVEAPPAEAPAAKAAAKPPKPPKAAKPPKPAPVAE